MAITPFQPNTSFLQGISGLKQDRQATEMNQMKMDAYKKQQADTEEASLALRDYYKTQNPESLVNATLKSPQLAGQVLQSIGIVDDQQKKAGAADIAMLWQARSNPEAFRGAMAKRVDGILQRQGNPSDSISLGMLYEQDPAKAEQMLKVAAAGLEAQGYKTGVFSQQEQEKKPYQQGTGDAAGFVFDPNTGKYTANPEVMQAIQTAKAAADAKDGKIDAKTIITLNDKVGSLTKDAGMIHSTASDIARLKKIGGGPASIAIVYKFMKALDPTSVVRETEFATAANAGGVPENIRNAYNKLMEGERLPESVIDDFEKTAKSLSDEAAGSAESAVQNYLDTFDSQLPEGLKQKLRNRIPKKFGVAAEAKEAQQPIIQAPQPALDYLKNNPQFKEQFKQKYGYLPEGI